MKDLTDKELAAVEEELLDKKDDKPTEAKRGKYAETAGKPEKPKVHGVVYIHCGQKERTQITESLKPTWWRPITS